MPHSLPQPSSPQTFPSHWGTQPVPSLQTPAPLQALPSGQEPQKPPQPSGPHCLPPQDATQSWQWPSAQPFSQTGTWVWNTTGSLGGTYDVRVNVRTAGSTAPFEARATIPYTLAMGVTLSPSLGSPRTVGTSVQWTAAAGGGSGSYEYQFWLYSYGTGAWSVVQPYGAGSTWTWNSTGLAPGNYLVDVWARNAGSTATFEVYLAVPYVLR